jgi:dihydroorotate dehydrogenase
MSLYQLFRPAVFALDPETAHLTSLHALGFLHPRKAAVSDPILTSTVAGLVFTNPVGLAAGYDKDALVPEQMLGFGFGAVEVGTLTPRPQAGNSKPRLFRLVEDEAVINRMGFNNKGVEAAARRLSMIRERKPSGVIGINIGANKDSDDRIQDYAKAFEALSPYADYVTINISSPNTPGLRALQDKAALETLIAMLMEARRKSGRTVPLFLKVAPDLTSDDVADVAAVALETKLDALIVSNTTLSRPDLQSRHNGETGGLSGAPLKALAQEMMIAFRRATQGRMPLIGVGGIASADDAYARIRAGASLIQIYSALVYHGPGLAKMINSGLANLLRRDGFNSLSEAVGVDVD